VTALDRLDAFVADGVGGVKIRLTGCESGNVDSLFNEIPGLSGDSNGF